MTTRWTSGALGFFLLFAAASPSAAQGQNPKVAGPEGGLGVQVLNTPLPVTGTVTGSVTAQITQKLYYHSSGPTCDAVNRCFVKFPAVPANKLLRVTHVHGAFFFTDANAFVSLDRNDLNTNVWVLPLTRFTAAYLGATLSFNEATDLVFEPGEIPILELGTTGTFVANTFNKLGITGELIDIQQ